MIDETLINQVKELQRTDPDAKLKWMSFTYESGNNKHDPRAHDASYLQEFFDKLEADQITIDPWFEKFGMGEPSKKELFVGRLPKDIEEYEVQAYFSEWGEIENLTLKEGKGYAFLTFTDPTIIDSILQHKDDHKIRDDWIDCKRTASRKGKGKDGDRKGKGKGKDGGKGKGGDRGGKGKGDGKGKGKGKGKGRPQPY